MLIDGRVSSCGDDINLVMTHRHGVDAEPVHRFAWDTFVALTDVAKRLHLYGAGQDLLADAFSGNVRGAGPGVAEMEIVERPSEPFIVFAADKCAPGRVEPAALQDVLRPVQHRRPDHRHEDARRLRRRGARPDRAPAGLFHCPAELYDLLVFIGTPGRFVIKHVFRPDDLDQPVASTSTSRLSLIAGRYVGKDDPIMIVRAQSGLPGVGEVLEPFAAPAPVAGWMRGSHNGPLMPCALRRQPARALRRPAAGRRDGLPARGRPPRGPARHARRRLLRPRPRHGAGDGRPHAPDGPLRAGTTARGGHGVHDDARRRRRDERPLGADRRAGFDAGHGLTVAISGWWHRRSGACHPGGPVDDVRRSRIRSSHRAFRCE